MSREELLKLTAKQLDEKCRELNLPRYKGKTHLNKTEMIEQIISTTASEASSKNLSTKQKYIENAELGSIVAFKDKRGLTRSGKIVENVLTDKVVHIALKSGRVFYVSYEDIVWITSVENRRWPKEVLNELKESQKKIEEDYAKKHRDISSDELQRLSKKMMGAR